METKSSSCPTDVPGASWIPILAVVTLIAIVLNIACSLLSSTLDTHGARGEQYISTPRRQAGLGRGGHARSTPTTANPPRPPTPWPSRVAEEGSVLLKNNGVLPLAEGSSVMPFGRAYLSPIYGQLSAGGSAKWVGGPCHPWRRASRPPDRQRRRRQDARAPRPRGTCGGAGDPLAGEAATVLGGDCKIYEYDGAVYDWPGPSPRQRGGDVRHPLGQEGQGTRSTTPCRRHAPYLALSGEREAAVRRRQGGLRQGGGHPGLLRPMEYLP